MFNWFKKDKSENEDIKDDNKEIEQLSDSVNDFENEETGFFKRLFGGLEKTRDNITKKITSTLGGYAVIDDDLYEELEEILISADVGVETTMELIDRVKDRIYEDKIKDPNEIPDVLADETKNMLKQSVSSFKLDLDHKPSVLLVIGVNGVGKTTTIGKIAHRLRTEGKKVVIAAADTFRAAAIDQLEEWANRSNSDIIKHSEGADPAAVVYDAITASKARDADVLICDTAGRLHNKSNLMKELNKIFRIIDDNFPQSSREVLLVLDATTGQNAMIQAKTFKETADISSIALTKLDGTAKGGVVIALQNELKIPVKLIGVGEKIEDLQDFNPDTFVDALFDRR
ncbi:MAG: signal recognition particle-docking protein FtsY [Tissierellia bacterium]|nr:signal recognition particle-docking protein FtsY [Tissierellia bacterium]